MTERRRQLTEWWTNPECFASTLIGLFVDEHGLEAAATWTAENVLLSVAESIDRPLPEENAAKLLTGIVLMTTNCFTVSLPEFMKFCCVLNGDATLSPRFMLPDVHDLAWGVTEGCLISEPDNPQSPFTPEIQEFVASILRAEGLVTVPSSLKIVGTTQDLMGELQLGFSDDPALFSAIQQQAIDRARDVDLQVQRKMQALLAQLWDVPLQRGDLEERRKSLSRMARALSAGSGDSLLPS